ncbi:hypothetical protein [Pseudobacillus wudalianchiensis]|nr:hypothetical protein [Bacillus wudalianchiensis]
MGELIFCFGYGGSLIVLGLITRVFILRMEKDVAPQQDQTDTIDEKVGI